MGFADFFKGAVERIAYLIGGFIVIIIGGAITAASDSIGVLIGFAIFISGFIMIAYGVRK